MHVHHRSSGSGKERSKSEGRKFSDLKKKEKELLLLEQQQVKLVKSNPSPQMAPKSPAMVNVTLSSPAATNGEILVLIL